MSDTPKIANVESIESFQQKIADFNLERGWSKDPAMMKDFLLNICEEAGEAWSVIKWVGPDVQKELFIKHKEKYEDFVGDSLYLILKIAWLLDIDSGKALLSTLNEYEQRFPKDKMKIVKHGNPLAGGIDDKENSQRK